MDGTEFGITKLIDADGSCTWQTPVINRGDKVMLLIHCDTGKALNGQIAERSDVWGMVQPEEGSAGVFSFRTPPAYTDAVFKLF